jgi:5-methylthioadenosine/S-adenosylhomocysteine deaminase
MAALLVRNAHILTMNDAFDEVEGDLLAIGGVITGVGRVDASAVPAGTREVDAAGGWLLPGFVQTHVHLCQTLFRGLADDLPLLEWLRLRIWPLEAAHVPATLRAAARLAACELLRGGTTAALTMETVHDTDAVFEAVAATGLRATIGKCMMDASDNPDVPHRLREATHASIDESLALHRRWHGAGGGRLRVALAPRFAVSCSRDLLEEVGRLSTREGILVHTHASESQAEVAYVRERSGLANMAYLDATGVASPHLCAAHCVWLDEHERDLTAARDVKVLHCPGSNLKLGSGLAPVVELRRRGVSVSLGADGAACNNRLSMFDEMRLAATVQAVRLGPGALPARDVLWMATRNGARALGLADAIGSIEPGKRADLVVVDRHRLNLAPGGDPYSLLVYAATADDVRAVAVDGELLVDDGELTTMDAREVIADARRAAADLVRRAGV